MAVCYLQGQSPLSWTTVLRGRVSSLLLYMLERVKGSSQHAGADD